MSGVATPTLIGTGSPFPNWGRDPLPLLVPDPPSPTGVATPILSRGRDPLLRLGLRPLPPTGAVTPACIETLFFEWDRNPFLYWGRDPFPNLGYDPLPQLGSRPPHAARHAPERAIGKSVDRERGFPRWGRDPLGWGHDPPVVDDVESTANAMSGGRRTCGSRPHLLDALPQHASSLTQILAISL